MKITLNWGTGIALVYAAFAIATTGFAVFAMEQRIDLVSSDYYQRALTHDQRMAAESNADTLGDAFRIDVSPSGRVLTLSWTAASPEAESLRAMLYRPADERLDRSLTVNRGANRGAQISLGDVAAGRWVLQIAWRSHGRDFYTERTVNVQ